MGCYEQHLALAQSLHDPAQATIALHNLGVLRYRQGRYAAAQSLHEQQRAIAQQLGDRPSEARALSGIAAARGAIGQYAEAIATYESALSLAQSLPDPFLETHILSNLGTLHLAQKRYGTAQTYHQQTLALAQQHHDALAIAQSQIALAQIDFFHTRYAQAQTRLRGVFDWIATLDAEAAVATEAIALRAWEHWGMVAYAQSQWSEAIAAHAQALALAQRIGDRHAEARALSNWGDATAQAGDRDRAVTLLEQAIERWSDLHEQLDSASSLNQTADLLSLDTDHIALFETQETTYSTLQQVLVDQGNIGQALEVAEQSRAQALRRLLVRNQLSTRDLPPEPTQTLADFRAIAHAEQATLVFYSMMDEVTDTDGIRERQPKSLQIWVISPQGEVNFRQAPIAPNANPQQLITTFQTFVLGGRDATAAAEPGIIQLEAPSFSLGMAAEPLLQDLDSHRHSQRDLNPFLRQLYDIAIAPIADLLPATEGDRLILMPHQSLFWFPFAALQSPTGDYLIEDYAISLAPSLATLALAQDRAATLAQQPRPWYDRPLIVGNPTMPSLPGNADPLDPLPHAEREAQQIAQLLQAQPLLGSQATKAALFEQWQPASLIHLATHGYLDSEHGLDSAIALTPTPTDSGWLLAKDLIARTGRDRLLNAHLAVLSACNTGRGRLTADGVVGLSRSFLAAGVPSVLVSQWSVPDAPTADLMIAFYQALLDPAISSRPGSQAIALRQAMLDQLQRHPHPRDWAGLILVGHTD